MCFSFNFNDLNLNSTRKRLTDAQTDVAWIATLRRNCYVFASIRFSIAWIFIFTQYLIFSSPNFFLQKSSKIHNKIRVRPILLISNWEWNLWDFIGMRRAVRAVFGIKLSGQFHLSSFDVIISFFQWLEQEWLWGEGSFARNHLKISEEFKSKNLPNVSYKTKFCILQFAWYSYLAFFLFQFYIFELITFTYKWCSTASGKLIE